MCNRVKTRHRFALGLVYFRFWLDILRITRMRILGLGGFVLYSASILKTEGFNFGVLSYIHTFKPLSRDIMHQTELMQ